MLVKLKQVKDIDSEKKVLFCIKVDKKDLSEEVAFEFRLQ